MNDWVAGSFRGLTRYDLRFREKKGLAPAVAVEKIRVRGKDGRYLTVEAVQDHQKASSKLTLQTSPPVLIVNFRGQSVDSDSLEYAYRFSGRNDEWNFVGRRTYAAFAGLKPGNYEFYVKAKSRTGEWGTHTTLLQIVILPPWWRSGWAILSYLILLSGGVLAFDRVQRKRIRKRARERVEQEYLNQQMELATSIQQKIIPTLLPQVANCEVEGFYLPSKDIGGDYYECFALSEDRYAMVVADVSGKGVSAAMLVNSLHAAIHVFMEYDDLHPSDLVGRLNNIIVDTCTTGMFVTLFVILIDTKTFEFASVNAGHPPMLHFTEQGARELHKGGIPLGICRDLDFQYDVGRLLPGERLLLFTDGISEAMNQQHELYGESKDFYQFVERAGKEKAGDFIDLLLQDIRTFTEQFSLEDDIAVLYLKRLK